MMLADARHIVYADPSVRAGKWEKKNLMGKEITGKIIGLVGLGAIGGLVAKRLQGFEMEILCYDPYVSEENSTALGVKMLPLNELLAKSDYVSLHMPENDKTKGIVNAEFLSKMKDGATLINCARAGLINEDDLRKAKSETGIRFLNDVYAKDAEGEKSVADIADVMMPHLGASTVEANYNAAKRAAEELMELDETGNSAFIVN
jgi:D-3-phosphoglycerate dehydrogenase